MSKSRPSSTSPHDAASGSRRGIGLGLGMRIVVSMLIMWHVCAVFMAGLSVPGSSILAGVIGQYYMQWYLDALAMNRGHHFFAPDPPPGHLIQYQIVDSKGNATVGEFPKRKEYWPRLRYHRYFMLASQPGVGADDERLEKEWVTKFLTGYALHLLRENDGERVSVRQVVHEVLPPPAARRPEDREMALNDPKTYHISAEVVKSRQDLLLEDRRQLDAAAGWKSGGLR